MDRIELSELEHSVERVWVAQPVQGRQQVISLGRLADGRWWASKDDGGRRVLAWVFGDELGAEAAAHRWSERSGLRWRQQQPADHSETTSPRRIAS